MQFYKGDENEQLMYDIGAEILAQISLGLQDFYNDCYNTFDLGALIYDNNRSPLSNAIPRQVFLESFNQIFQSFRVAGSFESYLDIFFKIFGDDVDVTLTVPGPGQLQIDILADEVILRNFVARRIEENVYEFDRVVTQDGDQIVFQTIKGFKSQYELEQMLFEFVPAGVYTEITLDLA